MKSHERLAEALEEAGLLDLAAKAREGYYHDFMSPLDTPAIQLAKDLKEAGTPEALAIHKRHVNDGEFDATSEEEE